MVVRVKDTHIFTMCSFLSTLFYVFYKPDILADMNHLKEVEISTCFWILDQMVLYCTLQWLINIFNNFILNVRFWKWSSLYFSYDDDVEEFMKD